MAGHVTIKNVGPLPTWTRGFYKWLQYVLEVFFVPRSLTNDWNIVVSYPTPYTTNLQLCTLSQLPKNARRTRNRRKPLRHELINSIVHIHLALALLSITRDDYSRIWNAARDVCKECQIPQKKNPNNQSFTGPKPLPSRSQNLRESRSIHASEHLHTCSPRQSAIAICG